MAKVRSLKSDRSDALVTRAQLVRAIRHMVEHDKETIASIAEIAAKVQAARPSWWQRVVRFFREGR